MRQTLSMLADTVKAQWMRDAAIGISASLLLAICSPLTIHLPFTPVPVTIQVQVALALAALMGSGKGVWMIIAFITQGAMGWPVFAGGATGITTIIGPRGGYLLGYLVAAYVVGSIYQSRKSRGVIALFLSMSAGNAIVYLCGFSWLSAFLGMKKAFMLGIVPFAIPDLIKLTLFALGINQVSQFLNYLRKK